ncbi:MAG: hypothetical protein PVJ57_06310 [Phycisphaerae bacterium]|jgi:prepilin-type processing-associated H-X9-DG protein
MSDESREPKVPPESEPPGVPPLDEPAPLDYAARSTHPPSLTLACAAVVCAASAQFTFGFVQSSGVIKWVLAGAACGGAVALGVAALMWGRRAPQRYGGRLIAVGAIVLAVLVPVAAVVSNHRQQVMQMKARRLVCATNLRLLGDACRAYANYEGYPAPPDPRMLVAGNMVPPSALQSPLEGDSLTLCDYAYVAGLNPAEDPGDWILAYGDPAHRNGYGANVLYLDGTVEFLEPKQFGEALAAFRKSYEAARGQPPTIVPAD